MDIIARQVVEPNSYALRQIEKRYGRNNVLKFDRNKNDYVLNRPALGKILFNDKKEKKWIESLLHPIILRRTAWEVFKSYLMLSSVVVIDAPLLFEASLHKYVGLSTLIYCNKGVQLSRLMNRDGVGEDDANIKLNAQMSIDDKVKLSDQVIDNNGSKEVTYNQIDDIVQSWYQRTKYWTLAQWICPPIAILSAFYIIYQRKLKMSKVHLN